MKGNGVVGVVVGADVGFGADWHNWIPLENILLLEFPDNIFLQHSKQHCRPNPNPNQPIKIRIR